MKLGLGLDVRKASAPAFKGLLDKFTGAVAAYSTRKLTASQPNILPADYGDGAAAAYSLRKVKASYSGNCIDVRRSSDNTTSSIGFSGNELDTTALEDFVGAQNLIYPSEDFGGASYTKQTGITATSNTSETTDPLGGSAAAKIVSTDATKGFYIGGLSFSTSSDLIRSIYLKGAVGGETAVLKDPSGYGGSTAVTLTTEWQRFTHSTSAGITDAQGIFVDDISVGTIYAFGAQCNEGTTAATYNKTTTGIGGDGFVTKWYDQSGTNHAEQGTDNDQPQIVDAGSTILENGKPAIQFDGVDDMLQKDFDPDIAQPLTLFHVRRYRSNGTKCAIGYDSAAAALADINVGSDFRSYYGTYLGTIEQNTDQGLWYSLANGASSEVGLNGAAAETGSAGNNGLEVLTIGSAFGSFDAPINTQEIIIFNSDQSDNRQDIEWNINNHYNIYTDSWDKQSAMEVRRAIDNETTNIGFVGKDLDTTALETFATESSPVLDDYTGAAAAYSLRKVRSAYTGSAVRVRRSSDDGLQDIGFDANGDLDSTALTTFVNEDYDHYTSDWSGDVDGWTVNNAGGGTVTLSNDTNRLKVDVSGMTTTALRPALNFPATIWSNITEGCSVTITIEGSNLVVDGMFVDGTFQNITDHDLDTGTFTYTFTKAASNTAVIYFNSTGKGDYVGFLESAVVTQTTADGAVTAWYDQSVPTETYVSDFSGGVDGFSATYPSNNTATRLASVTDNYSTTVENVLQFEAATAGTGITQQLRNNIPLTVGSTYKVSFKMLIDSGNTTLVKAGLYDGSGTTPEDIVFGGKLTETGRWTTFTDVPITQENVRLLFAGLDSSDSFSFNSTEGDKFYIADVSVDEVNDATQTTDNDQPLIVDGGTLVTEGGKASIHFGYDGSTPNFLTNSTISKSGDIDTAIFSVHISLGGSGNYIYDGFDSPDYFGHNNASRGVTFNYSSQLPDNVHQLITRIGEVGGLLSVYKNGLLHDSGAGGIVGDDGVTIGTTRSTTVYQNSKQQELIIFNSDQSDNRTGIEGNIGRYYNIDGFRDVFVTKWFDQSGNFNHAENSTDTEQPQIVDGGTLVEADGNAAVDFNQDLNLQLNSPIAANDDFFISSVLYIDSSNQQYIFNRNLITGYNIFIQDNDVYLRNQSGIIVSNTSLPQNWNLVGLNLLTFYTDSSNAYVVAQEIDTSSSYTTRNNLDIEFIGSKQGGRGYLGKLSEMIVFESDQSANRTDIESNINKHFKIYEE